MTLAGRVVASVPDPDAAGLLRSVRDALMRSKAAARPEAGRGLTVHLDQATATADALGRGILGVACVCVLPFGDLAVLKETYARLVIHAGVWTSPRATRPARTRIAAFPGPQPWHVTRLRKRHSGYVLPSAY
jgi:hypothetical protein